MIDRIIQQLAAIAADGHRGTVALEGQPADERWASLIDQINGLLEEVRRQKRQHIRLKSDLLSDIDALSEVLEKISLGRFNLRLAEVGVPEMDTLQIGVRDMAVRLRRYSDALEQKIEELRKSQRRVREEREAAQAATRAKSEFLANMSHEIRTPLNAIMGFCALLLKTRLNGRQRDQLNKVKSSARILLAIINDILDFSKVEAGMLKLENVEFNLLTVIDNLVDMFSPIVTGKGIELLVSVERDVPCGLVGDPIRLGQVLSNLVSNAAKFTDEGEIVIRIELDDEGDSAEEVTLRASVSDSGIGIADEQIARLFDPFTQGDASTTRKFGGTGLGLAICRRLVEMMGGRIWAEKRAAGGTTFSFTVRIGRRGRDPRGRPRAPLPEGTRVLVVDDNAAAREMLRELLASFSMKATAVCSGEEALRELRGGEQYRLVILDWRMPGMDGLETAAQIKADERLRQIPIILLTAFGSKRVSEQAERLGIDAYLNKPIKQSVLFDVIINIVGGKRWTEEGAQAVSDTGTFPGISGARILLVEDNPMNQEVALELLKEVGLGVDVAENGEVALRLLQACDYQAVLMDMQMPVLDGYQTTRAIRHGRFRGPSGTEFDIAEERRRVPVIAMTAHAMKGDREKCLEAGADDYLQKPIAPEQLYATIRRWVAGVLADEVASGEAQRGELGLPAALPGIDVAAGLRDLRGDESLFVRLCRRFVADHGTAGKEIAEAIAASDRELAARLLHTVKGACGTFGAKNLARAAEDLEDLLEGDSAAIEPALARFGGILERVVQSARVIVEVSREAEKPDADRLSEPEPAVLASVVAELAHHLQRNNLKAETSLEELRAGLSGWETEGLLERLEDEVGRFAFKEAKSTLGELAAMLGLPGHRQEDR